MNFKAYKQIIDEQASNNNFLQGGNPETSFIVADAKRIRDVFEYARFNQGIWNENRYSNSTDGLELRIWIWRLRRRNG